MVPESWQLLSLRSGYISSPVSCFRDERKQWFKILPKVRDSKWVGAETQGLLALIVARAICFIGLMKLNRTKSHRRKKVLTVEIQFTLAAMSPKLVFFEIITVDLGNTCLKSRKLEYSNKCRISQFSGKPTRAFQTIYLCWRIAGFAFFSSKLTWLNLRAMKEACQCWKWGGKTE